MIFEFKDYQSGRKSKEGMPGMSWVEMHGSIAWGSTQEYGPLR